MFREGRATGVRRVGVLTAAAVALVALALAPWGSASQSTHGAPPSTAVVDWNLNAINALVNPATAAIPGAGQTPPVSMQHLAMVQGAVYDAVNMIDRGYEPYFAGLPSAPRWASQSAAVATAAHHVLVGVVIVPALSPAIVTRLNDLYTASLAAATAADGTAAVNAGIAAGAAAAARMLAERAHDGRYPAVPFMFTVGTQAGEWRPTSGVNDPFAWIAKVQPFVLKNAAQVRSKGPHDLDSRRYAKEYNEVKDYGGNGTITPTSRTPEQTTMALFFANNPVELFNRTFRGIASAEGLSTAEQARLFVKLSLAGADAAIGCWDDKAFWNFWRPVTAIHEGDNDSNRRTAGDAAWTPLVTTPPYPDHTSGYNCYTGAIMNTAKAFFGNRFAFSLSAPVAGVTVTRNYERFTDVPKETIDARVLLGIHFRAPDVQGARLGKEVARWLDKHYFQRTKHWKR